MLLTIFRGRANLKGSIFREPDGTLDKGATGRSPLRDQTRGLWVLAGLDHEDPGTEVGDGHEGERP